MKNCTITMRNIFVCLMAIALVTIGSSCEKNVDDYTPSEPVVEYYFGAVETEVSESSVMIVADKPRITIDGYTLEQTKIKVGYQSIIRGVPSDEQYNDDAGSRDGKVIFKIDDLMAATDYVARLYIDDAKSGYSAVSKDFTFTTSEHKPVCAVSYKIDIDTRGLFATVKFTDLMYTVDEEQVPISRVVFEYRRSHSTPQEWIVCERSGEEISAGRLTIELPTEGEEYLMELNKYEYRVTVAPEDATYTTYTHSVGNFYTQDADVEIAVATPQLTFEDDIITLLVDNIDITYDGVASEDYPYSSISEDCYILWRRKGSEEWTREWVIANDGSITKTYRVTPGESEIVLEFKVAVYAGRATPRASYETEVVEITISPEVAE